jgi:hypothetical protein
MAIRQKMPDSDIFFIEVLSSTRAIVYCIEVFTSNRAIIVDNSIFSSFTEAL